MSSAADKEFFDFMILKMWYCDWDEDRSISNVVLLNVDDKLDECVRQVVTDFALIHNRSRPKEKLVDKHSLTSIMQEDIANLKISEQLPCSHTNHTMMNILSYTDTKGDGHIEVMGLYTTTYEILG